ncbi:MAG: type I polyketide synthase [Mycobacterium sp.]
MSSAAPDRRSIIADALRKIDDLTERLQIAEEGDTEPIAVVGIGCRLPGGVNDPEQYWQLLRDGASGVVRVPENRWDVEEFYSAEQPVPGTMCTREGGFLTSWQPDEFDAEFFGISPREAIGMDPQQRLLMEVTWEALENAGVTATQIRGSQTGVFVGLTTTDYIALGYERKGGPEDVNPYITFGNASNFAAGRLSYFLGAQGPAVVVDTACSSSLVTIHLAVQSLRRRETDRAIAAGVNLNLLPDNFIACSQWGMLAPDGLCKTFDAAADGYVRSEGAGVVVLKRLRDAVADGDNIWAVVRGTAVNQDGPSSGQTVPSGPAQQAVMRSALAAARVTPAEVDYVEAHGTGTQLGDPIELDALAAVFGDRGDSAPLVLGSVKTNIGHLESAAGVAGFIKTVLSVQRGVIPKHLYFDALTPHAGPGAAKFTIAAQELAWPAVDRVRRAGVSSFGVSGTNAHVIVEQAPDAEVAPAAAAPVVSSLVLSGKSAARVAAQAGVLAEWLDGAGSDTALADVAHTLAHHRSRFKTVAGVCARDRAGAIAGLKALATGDSAPGVVDPHLRPIAGGRVFVYSGQGSHWPGMGRQLLADEPVFAAAVDELEPVFAEHVGFSLKQILTEGTEISGDAQVQPVIMGLQLALTTLLRSYGVEPAAVIGHSMGEVTAAVVSGALTVPDGLKVIGFRSKLMSKMAGQGAVALVELDAEATEALIAGHSGVSIAGYLSPRQTVIAGPPDQVDAVIAAVAAQDRFARRVNMEVASHTAFMDPILPELRSALADLVPSAPAIPFISTVTEDSSAPRLDADYWVANVRQPARVSQAVTAAAADYGTFLEVSPHPLLTYNIGDTLEATGSGDNVTVSSALRRVDDETVYFHTQLATLGAPGRPAGSGRPVQLPPSPWQHDTSYWVEDHSQQRRVADLHPLLGPHVEMLTGGEHIWQTELDARALPWLADRIQGQPVLSAAGIADMVLSAGRTALGLPVEGIEVTDLQIEQPLVLDQPTRVTTRFAPADTGYRVEIHAKAAAGWRRHVVATVLATPGPVPAVPAEPGAGWTETDIALPDDVPGDAQYAVHPALLASALQALAAAISADQDGTVQLPTTLATVRVFGHVGRRARCRIEPGRILLVDDAGAATAELSGIEFAAVDPGSLPTSLDQMTFTTEWVEAPLAAGQAAPGSWVLLADGDAGTKALVATFAARFESSTRRLITADLTDDAAVAAAVAKAAADPDLPAAGMIAFIDRGGFDATDPDGTLRRSRELIVALSQAARAAAAGWQGNSARLWLITRDGLAVRDGESGDPTAGALRGVIRTWRFPGELARTLAEEPDLGATLVDLDGEDADVVTAVLDELASPVRDDVIARRAGVRYAERLTRAAVAAGAQDAAVRPDGAYIITGGLGGLGLVFATWLAERGAGRIVLSGRREPSADEQRRLDQLGATGTEIAYLRGDLAAPDVAQRLVAAAEETGRLLRGVLHSAGVLDESLVSAVTADGLERVWAAKATGAMRMHLATADRPLDWWVGFSSMAALLGLPGQLSYATANAWLDGFVTWLRAAGRPATAVSWGQWSDVGIGASMTLSVLDPISPAEGVDALQTLLGQHPAHVGVARLRLDRALTATPEFRDLGYFEAVVAEADTRQSADGPAAEDGDGSVAPVEDWSAMTGDQRRDGLKAGLQAILGHELRMPARSVDVEQPFPEMGLDSMMAMTVLKQTQQLAGIDLSASMLWNHPTIAQLANHLAELLEPDEEPVSPLQDSNDDADSLGGGVLDELFESVESAPGRSESSSL